ncbi:MAG: 2-oxo acid dehydrogenase subunit E2 [Deltaproteobacteria bacterium]|nr:2-oxo acid dehydrogenase subunit E2 [Deltaproteobacteria bacterium]
MSVDVVMPKLSDTMEEGKILRWLKKPGEAVAVGDVLAEVETDKADMEIEAEAEGVLAKILVDEGGSVAVGQKIAVLDGVDRRERAAAKSAPAPRPAEGESAAAEPEPAAPGPRRAAAPRPPAPPRATAPRPPAPHAARTVPPAPRPVAGEPRAAGREELSRIRRTVARRMAESKREVPHFYMTVEADMAECARLKASLAAVRPDAAASYTHLLLRAVAMALAQHPRVNARYAGEGAVEFSDDIHLGIAVALEAGLIVPVLHDCGSKDVFTIAEEARALVERVRTGKAGGGDLSGGTFTVSNLGMYPIEEFAAVINPPQAAVLATGAVVERAVVRGGQVVPRLTLRMTLSSDHRVIDGAEAAQFLATLKELLESPLRLVL